MFNTLMRQTVKVKTVKTKTVKTKTVNFTTMGRALITALTASFVILPLAHAEDSYRLDTSELDFNSRSDMAGLYVDIVKAADKVCDTKGNDSISVRVNPAEYRRTCRKYTVQETLAALDQPLLNAVNAGLPSNKRYSLNYIEQALQTGYASSQ